MTQPNTTKAGSTAFAATLRGGFRAGLALCLALSCGIFASQGASAASRIKDIADFEGIRDNLLIGYGLVVGLNGTGDRLRNAPFTRQSLESMLERLGVNTRNANASTKNVAAVIVTANLRPFARQGTRFDVTISALGDARSLLGGALLVTPLLGADGEVYAVAQGPLAVGGFAVGGQAETVVKGVPTSARIANGAIVEREIGFELASLTTAKIALRNPDLTTARRMANVINKRFEGEVARSLDPATVAVVLPAGSGLAMVDLLADIEQLRVEPDQIARVVIDEHSGIIVIGADVRVDEIAIAQGNLTIRVTETPQVSQPNAFSQTGTTEIVPRTQIEVDEESNRRLAVLNRGVSLRDLVDGLNALGVGPRDLISILQIIKSAGALQAEIMVQ